MHATIRRYDGVDQNRTAEQGEYSTKAVTSWIREEKLESVLPNAPKITHGQVVVHSNGVA